MSLQIQRRVRGHGRGPQWLVEILFAVVLGVMATPCSAAEQVGAASSLRPSAEQTPVSATKSQIQLNAPIFRNATLETAANGLLEVTFLDQSKLALGGGSSVVVDEFAYTGPGAPGTQVLNFAKGVFRFISGGVPKDKVKIVTPTSLIGIRGTELRIRVEPDGTTTLGVDEGRAFVVSRQTGQEVTVDPGEKVTIKATGEMGEIVIGHVEGCPG